MRRWKSLSTAAKYFFAATCVAGAFAVTTTATKADGMARGRAPAAMPTSWSGFYFGVDSGYQWSTVDVHGPAAPAGIGISSNHDEFFVGIHGGVQHQFGAIVLGIEGGWLSTLRDREGSGEFCDSVTPSLTNPMVTPGNFCKGKLNDIVSVGGRLGWAAGHWMPYITGGYANAGYDFLVRTPNLVESAHARLDGWYIGGGLEWVVSPGWTVGIEYKHYEFEPRTTTAFSPAGGALETVRFDATTDTVSARVSWRWDLPGLAPAAPLK